MNNIFFSASEIYARLIATYPLKGSEINKVQIKRWASELLTDILVDPVSKIMNNKVQIGYGEDMKVIKNSVPLPANIFKIEAIYGDDYRLLTDYSVQGSYVYFSDRNTPTKVYIDYLSLAIDNDGFPLLYRGYERAAEAYCTYKMFEEDATRIPPKIAQWRWMQIVQDKDWEIEAASRSWNNLTDNDMKDILGILYKTQRDLLGDIYSRNTNTNNITE